MEDDRSKSTSGSWDDLWPDAAFSREIHISENRSDKRPPDSLLSSPKGQLEPLFRAKQPKRKPTIPPPSQNYVGRHTSYVNEDTPTNTVNKIPSMLIFVGILATSIRYREWIRSFVSRLFTRSHN